MYSPRKHFPQDESRYSKQKLEVRNSGRDHSRMLLTSLLLMACSVYSPIVPGPLAQWWIFSQLARPSHINLQSRKCATGFPTSKSVRTIFLIVVPSFQMTLDCGKITQNYPVDVSWFLPLRNLQCVMQGSQIFCAKRWNSEVWVYQSEL